MKSLRPLMILSVVYVCLLVGCVSTDQVIKPDDIADFRLGVTTQQQVVARLGTPSATSTLPDGSTYLTYAFTEPQSATAQWIPAIAPFVGGTTPRSSTISFQFGPDGILNTVNTASSRLGPVMHREQ
ncbi:outer membrane protein assembly factor BamE domain-containing protein [Trinickia violacea]|nr:outer membrane protein assembly factor BamE [Trinickia violacea]